MKFRLCGLIVASTLLFSIGCKTARITSEQNYASANGGKPVMVYVSDFELGLAAIHHQDGLLEEAPGPVGRLGQRLSGVSSDSARRAHKLVDLMANSLVKDLRKAGFSAERVYTGPPPSSDGWLLRGIFTEVQEGNRVRRAMIGFGEGQTDVQVVTRVDNLSKGDLKPLYEIATEATSGSQPGAAPTLVLGPYGAAARFVMSGADLEKNVKQTANRIASTLAEHINAPHE